ncbi:MAG: glutathione synthase [Sphingobacterium sp.]|uniref:glutathione synthetase n=1 Tax=Sphingobacterium sp. JB170 TaxID=1434842 RepID=UPI00097F43CE|nr:glutathione synthetase [Sphingobacterium sp. JB170]SJN49460.1 Similar to Glutathione synthetase [Sphingobacterium sp. JB170]
MTIAFLINQTHKELSEYTTTLLALTAHRRSHKVLYIGVADFAYHDEKTVGAHCRVLESSERVSDEKDLMRIVRKKDKQFVTSDEIDLLWIRHDPVTDMISRPWASSTALQFAQLMKRQGTWVINDPDQLMQATNKMYLEYFPKEIRPKTLVTRSYEDVLNFLGQQNGKIILKPLTGSGGKNVFMVKKGEKHNLKQTVEVIARDGYLLAQEYLPAAAKGDIRFFLLDGEPIVMDGKYAAISRMQQKGEIRSNIHQGGSAKVARITKKILATIDKVSQKLKDDGMYFVGLDIVGDIIMEINVFSPGALIHAGRVNDTDFIKYVIAHLEKKFAERQKEVKKAYKK